MDKAVHHVNPPLRQKRERKKYMLLQIVYETAARVLFKILCLLEVTNNPFISYILKQLTMYILLL